MSDKTVFLTREQAIITLSAIDTLLADIWGASDEGEGLFCGYSPEEANEGLQELHRSILAQLERQT